MKRALKSLQFTASRRISCGRCSRIQISASDRVETCPDRRNSQNENDVNDLNYRTRIKVYDSLRREKVPLVISEEKVLKWYACGPTVYDDAHIGHGYCYVKFDIIRRILQKFFTVDVVYLMGVTDIDDKIINRAKQENIEFQAVAKKYEAEFVRDMQALHVQHPTIVTRVTDFVPQILQFVTKIIDNGHAYVAEDGSVYFNVDSYRSYGAFKQVQPSAEPDEPGSAYKRNSYDFALWKAAKLGEPSWDSPWGRGRPGWHIECSVMASHVFGRHVDIHSGGVDLIFPHHENEAAQCGAFHQTDRWVSHWLHSGHLYLKDEKMSKSLKNTITIQDFLKTHSADKFRIVCLLTNLKNNVVYTPGLMDEATAVNQRLVEFLNLSRAYVKGQIEGGNLPESELLKSLSNCRREVMTAFCDNFDTHRAMSAVLQLVSTVNKCLGGGQTLEVRSPVAVAAITMFVERFCSNLGLNGVVEDEVSRTNTFNDHMLVDVLNSSTEFRQQVRRFALAEGLSNASTEELNAVRQRRLPLLKACDQMRDSMSAVGIKLQDRASGCQWSLTQPLKTRQ